MSKIRNVLIASSLILGFALSPLVASNADAATKGNRRVMMVQEKLNAGGANLTADGVMGSRTRAAIADYQKAHGLRPTGRLNDRTVAMIRKG